MRWISVFYIGLFGWAQILHFVRIRIILADCLETWWGTTLLVIVGIPLLVALVVWIYRILENSTVEKWINDLADDVMRFSEMKCGNPKGWVYSICKTFCLIWILPGLSAFFYPFWEGR